MQKMRNRNDAWTPFMKATMLNMAILALWYLLEYAQFGELQWGRIGDDAVGLAYYAATYLLFRRCDMYERMLR